MYKKTFVFIYLLILGVLSTSCSEDSPSQNTQNVTADSLSLPGWDLVWHDEFNYTGKPDPNKWDYDIGDNGWGNNELQYYTDDSVNVRVEDNKLILEAHYYPDLSIKYTSARIVSRNKGDWLYGRIEVKAILPGGRGTWPAIWMLPTDWVYGGWPMSGEIDIMEHVGYDPNVIHGSVHTQKYNHKIGTQKSKQIKVPTALSAFHVYAIEWDADKIDFYVDENKYFTFSNEHKTFEEWPFDQRFHLIMNIAIGGNWGGAQGIDNSVFPQKMLVDYVRVYKKK